MCLLSKTYGFALRRTEPPIQWAPINLSPRLKRPQLEAVHVLLNVSYRVQKQFNIYELRAVACVVAKFIWKMS